MLPPDSSWPQPLSAVTLPSDEVHVWRVDLALSPDEEIRRTTDLCQNERERANRFLSIPARTQFVAARSALRTILGRYLTREPSSIVFELGPLGKPSLRDADSLPLFFNLSHSKNLALVAVTRCGEIGVDVEHVRVMSTADDLAERFFHPNEIAALQSLPSEQRLQGFFNAWTRKEAFLKATGKGISFGIDRVEVALKPDELPRVLTLDGDPGAALKWSLESFIPAEGYVGAVAMEWKWEKTLRFTYQSFDEKR